VSVAELYVGNALSGGLYRVGRGYADGGTPYDCLLTTRPLLFDGVAGEGTVTAIYLGVTQRPPPLQDGDPYDEVVFTLTPIVDGREELSREVVVRMQPVYDPSNPAPRVFQRYEVGVYRGEEEVRRDALRGVSIQVRIELASTDIAVEGMALEVELVNESNREQGG
jgi:hypothetical protein